MKNSRKEEDYLGEREISADALYGIHALRAKENFPHFSPINESWFRAVGLVKLSFYEAYEKFKSEVETSYSAKSPLVLMDSALLTALKNAAEKVSQGEGYNSLIVPAISGGAGTSLNMNVNEIISNMALLELNKKLGDYQSVHPNDHANIYQSTNDVIPTALKIALLQKLKKLESVINLSREEFERLENRYRHTLRIAYTQMQEAVPSSYGRLFANYQEAFSRDWWRVSKCEERLKVVNVGGSAIGTGMAVPKFMIFKVIEELRELTKLPLARGENMGDTTSNLDSLVEVHAILKAHAVNLEKVASDIRLLASDLTKSEVKIEAVQVGSSIMPGKINPVISEYLISIAHKIYANDSIVSSLSAQGTLDLNAYLPIIGEAMLESLDLLLAANVSLKHKLLSSLIIDEERAKDHLFRSPSIATMLLPYIGYERAGDVARLMRERGVDIFVGCAELHILSKEKIEEIFQASEILKLGFTLTDLTR